MAPPDWSDPPPRPPPMTFRKCLICNLELACLIGGLAAFLWMLTESPEESDDPAQATRALLGHGLRGAGVQGPGLGGD